MPIMLWIISIAGKGYPSAAENPCDSREANWRRGGNLIWKTLETVAFSPNEFPYIGVFMRHYAGAGCEFIRK